MEEINFSKIYSYSKLEMFKKCRRQYYFYYLDPEISPRKKEFIKPRDYKTIGQAVHGAITLFYHLPPKERSFEKLKKILFQAWFSEKDPSKAPPLGESGGFRDINHERQSYRKALLLLKNFFQFKDINPPIFYLPSQNIKDSFDDYKEMIVPINNDFFISGKFDRIDKTESQGLKIIDFKTGKNQRDNFQLEFYTLLAEMNFKTPVQKVCFYYLESRKIVYFDFSKINRGETIKKIIKRIKTIQETKDFPPRPGKLCSHCDFKEICPAFKKG